MTGLNNNTQHQKAVMLWLWTPETSSTLFLPQWAWIMSSFCSVNSWKYKLKVSKFPSAFHWGWGNTVQNNIISENFRENISTSGIFHIYSVGSILNMKLRDPDTGMSNYYKLSDSGMETQTCFSTRKKTVYEECSNWDLEASFVTVR